MMDAAPLLARIAAVLDRHHLEVIVIGNAAAALHGAQAVTTDIDFLFPKRADSMDKLRAVAADLNTSVVGPLHAASDLYWLSPDACAPQIVFVAGMNDIAFPVLYKRATRIKLGSVSALVCNLTDVIETKKAIETLRDECGLGLVHQIRRLLALAPEKRTHFLRTRIGVRMSSL
jgi:hypothetical protein